MLLAGSYVLATVPEQRTTPTIAVIPFQQQPVCGLKCVAIQASGPFAVGNRRCDRLNTEDRYLSREGLTFFWMEKEKRWLLNPRQCKAELRLSILLTSVLTRYKAPIGI
jgi:hypothetical protein